jgi:phosphopantothenoylcysteine synthetase/decarboxylase
MNILVTAGNTLVPIDRVRCLTNVFTGRTGTALARCAWERGHRVTLLTSHPEVVEAPQDTRWVTLPYRTFEDLQRCMSEQVRGGALDAVIHCAAVSDYLAGGVFAPREGTHFHLQTGRWESDHAVGPMLIDRAADKIKSEEPELWLRLVRAPKLVDYIRREWKFCGLLVKFKLEVGVREEQLLAIAEASRMHSGADLMVANTLEEVDTYAYVGPLKGKYERVLRSELAARLLTVLEQLPRKANNG